MGGGAPSLSGGSSSAKSGDITSTNKLGQESGGSRGAFTVNFGGTQTASPVIDPHAAGSGLLNPWIVLPVAAGVLLLLWFLFKRKS